MIFYFFLIQTILGVCDFVVPMSEGKTFLENDINFVSYSTIYLSIMRFDLRNTLKNLERITNFKIFFLNLEINAYLILLAIP